MGPSVLSFTVSILTSTQLTFHLFKNWYYETTTVEGQGMGKVFVILILFFLLTQKGEPDTIVVSGFPFTTKFGWRTFPSNRRLYYGYTWLYRLSNKDPENTRDGKNRDRDRRCKERET